MGRPFGFVLTPGDAHDLHGIQTVIPGRRGRNHSALHERWKYRLRSRIEQVFGKLENW